MTSLTSRATIRAGYDCSLEWLVGTTSPSSEAVIVDGVDNRALFNEWIRDDDTLLLWNSRVTIGPGGGLIVLGVVAFEVQPMEYGASSSSFSNEDLRLRVVFDNELGGLNVCMTDVTGFAEVCTMFLRDLRREITSGVSGRLDAFNFCFLDKAVAGRAARGCDGPSARRELRRLDGVERERPESEYGMEERRK